MSVAGQWRSTSYSKRNGHSDPIDFNGEDWSPIIAVPVWCL